MSILDQLDRKITKIGKDAIKKTKDVSESVMVTSLIKEEENKLKEEYQKIGKYFYESLRKSSDATIESLCQIIDGSKSKLEELNEQLRQLKKLVACPKCGTNNPIDALFCVGCGVKLESVDPIANSKERICSNCGLSLNEDQMFCTNCGTKYVEKVEPIKKELVIDEKVQIEKTNKCLNCGAELEENQKFCNKCGASCVEESIESENNICPDCGKKLKPNQKFCTGCGRKI